MELWTMVNRFILVVNRATWCSPDGWERSYWMRYYHSFQPFCTNHTQFAHSKSSHSLDFVRDHPSVFIWHHKKLIHWCGNNGGTLSSRCTSSWWDYMVKSSVIMCDSQAKCITGLCRRAKGRYSGQLEGEAGGTQQHSRLAQPNTHVCMKLECQHLIHAAGWWLWNKLCQRVAAAKFHWAAADSGYVEVMAGRRFLLYKLWWNFLRDKF